MRPALTDKRLSLPVLLRLLAGLFLGLMLAGAGLTALDLREAGRLVDRMAVAERVHTGHLALAARVEAIHRRHAEARVTGAATDAPAADPVDEGLARDFAQLRAGIAAEIELVGDGEIVELDRLAEIERRIGELMRADIDEATVEADAIIALIGQAVSEEIAEIAEARVALDALLVRHRIGTLVFAVAAVLVTVIAGWLIERRVGWPLRRLGVGIRRIAAGSFEHRVTAGGVAETVEVERAINRLAEHVDVTTGELESRNAQLERLIADRTRQFENALEDAQRAEARRRRMLADVSHELRTPLTVIRGEADVALRGGPKPADEYRDALLRARDAAEHTARIVDDLLFIARTEGGEARLRLGEVELRGLLDGVLETFSPGLGVTSHILRAPILADPDRLRQAVLILLENARRYGGRDIVLRLDPTPEGYRIAVEDDGPGMSDEDKEMAFQRYFRGANAADRHVEGLGLGLPVARSIAEAHGGTIILSDREGGGLVAALTVPLKPLRETVRPAA